MPPKPPAAQGRALRVLLTGQGGRPYRESYSGHATNRPALPRSSPTSRRLAGMRRGQFAAKVSDMPPSEMGHRKSDAPQVWRSGAHLYRQCLTTMLRLCWTYAFPKRPAVSPLSSQPPLLCRFHRLFLRYLSIFSQFFFL